jgi:hypothetical protein
VGVAAKLDRQQVEPRIEPDDELRAFVLDRMGDAIGESLGRRGSLDLHLHSA